jgi:hypothetical protein
MGRMGLLGVFPEIPTEIIGLCETRNRRFGGGGGEAAGAAEKIGA